MNQQVKQSINQQEQNNFVQYVSHGEIFKNYLDMNVWQLRHLQVSKFIQAHSIKNILDVGCAEGPLINRLSRSQYMQHLIGIDFNADVLQKARHNVQPQLMQESIAYCRNSPLIVQLYHLNMLQALPLKKFKDIELVTLIQFIEHINEKDLKQLCQQIFKKINPKYIIITTPNQQFNVHFNFKPRQMRHPQHLFQWNRQQFRSFCQDISNQYQYSFEIFGVGEHITDDSFGFCSQGAFFKRNKQLLYTINEAQLADVEPYQHIRYPFWKDNIYTKIQHQIKQIILKNNYQSPALITEIFKKSKICKKIEEEKQKSDSINFNINQSFIIEYANKIKYCGYCPQRNWIFYQYQSSSLSEEDNQNKSQDELQDQSQSHMDKQYHQ